MGIFFSNVGRTALAMSANADMRKTYAIARYVAAAAGSEHGGGGKTDGGTDERERTAHDGRLLEKKVPDMPAPRVSFIRA